jgi:hypothetical protein
MLCRRHFSKLCTGTRRKKFIFSLAAVLQGGMAWLECAGAACVDESGTGKARNQGEEIRNA